VDDQHDHDEAESADRPELAQPEPSAISRADPVNLRPVRHFVGVDLGQQADFSAVAVVQHSEAFLGAEQGWADFQALRYLRRWPLKTPYPQIVRNVGRLVSSGKLIDPLMVVDSTGVGRAVCDLFAEAGLGVTMRRVTITAGHKVNRDEDGGWLVPKRELVSVVQRLLQTRRLTFAKVPSREILVRELLAFRIKISTALNEIFESWRERDHDDLVLATALACWAAEATAARRDEPMPESFGRPVYHDDIYAGPRPRRRSNYPWEEFRR